MSPPGQSRLSTLVRDTSQRLLARVISRRCRRARRRVGIVLMYHGVATRSGDPRACLVPPLAVNVLRGHFRYFRRRFDVVSIHDLRTRLTAQAPGDRFPVALTFDDDLQSHLAFVAPLLTEFAFPATFFLTGSSLEGPCAFWWHDLEELFARGGDLWREVSREVGRRWGAAPDDVDLHTVSNTMVMMSPDERDSLARRLRELVASPPRDRGLPAPAVRELVAAGFEIGFHTKSHYHLQSLDNNALHRAMRDGAERLSAASERPLTAIAYPHGGGDLRIAAAAADAGFELGFVCGDRPVDATSHPMLLERVDGWGVSVGELAWRLARFTSTQ